MLPRNSAELTKLKELLRAQLGENVTEYSSADVGEAVQGCQRESGAGYPERNLRLRIPQHGES